MVKEKLLARFGLQKREPFGIVITTDPGPDPDDIKALLIAGVLHKQGDVVLHAVVTNGGQQPDMRARLARCLLDGIGTREIPVGIGSQGKPYTAQPHEYQLRGFADVQRTRLEDGHSLLLRVLRSAPKQGITFVCISSLRDVADLMQANAELFIAKAREVVVMGGLERGSDGEWRPDTSVNNEFDRAGAAYVYSFCFDRGVPLTVLSRNAVPMLPMQLAKSFAVRTNCPIMTYLADAQFLGLEGLWLKLCEGRLPARCTKQWYFQTFCGVEQEEFEANNYEQLGASENIIPYLNGYVTPYDVLALMSALPLTHHLFERGGSAVYVRNHVKHSLFLGSEHAIDVRHVLKLLRDTFHEVALATKETYSMVGLGGSGGPGPRGLASPEGRVRDRLGNMGLGGPARVAPRGASGAAAADAGGHLPVPRTGGAPLAAAADGRGALRPGLRTLDDSLSAVAPISSGAGGAVESVAITGVLRAPGQPLPTAHLQKVLEAALAQARKGQRRYSLPTALCGVLLTAGALGLFLVDRDWSAVTGGPADPTTSDLGIVRTDGASMLFTPGVTLVALALQPTQPFLPHVRLTVFAVIVFNLGYLIEFLVEVAQPGAAQASNRLWEQVLYGAARWLCAVFLARALWIYRLRVRPLMLALLQTLGFGTVCEAIVVLLRRSLNGWVTGERGTAVAVTTVVRSVYKSLWGGLLLWPHMHLSARALFAKMVTVPGGDGSLAPIAPLIGFGTKDEAEVPELIRVALIVFVGAPVNEELLYLIGQGRRAADKGKATSQHGRGGPFRRWGGAGREPGKPGAVTAAAAAAAATKRRKAVAHGSASLGNAHGGAGGAAANGLGRRDSRMPSSMMTRALSDSMAIGAVGVGSDVDFYLVHSWHDSPSDKQAALGAWAQRWAEAHGRLPVVWLDAMCADPSLSPHEHLHHMVVYLAKCRRLLLLAGPTVADRLWTVCELYTWLSLGGTLDDVEVVPVAFDAAARDRVIASFDAFAVMYARSSREEDKARIVHSVEIAIVSRFNEVVRSYLPRIRQAIEHDKAIANGIATEI